MRIPSEKELPSLHIGTFLNPVLNSFSVFAFLWSVGMCPHSRAGKMMQLKAAAAVGGKL